MRLRLLIALAAPLAAAVYLLHYNRGEIALRLSEDWEVRLPVAGFMLAAALAGAAAAAVFGWVDGVLKALSRGRRRWAERGRERARAHLSEAQRLRGEGNLRRARRQARRALRQGPEFAAALLLAGDLAAEAGDFEEAIRWHERARALSPDSPDLAVRLASHLEASGRTRGAENILAHAAGEGRDHPVVLRRLRDLLVGAGRWEEAHQAAAKIARLGGTAAEKASDERAAGRILLAAAGRRLSASDGKGAAALLEEAIKRAPAAADARLLLGDAYAADGRGRKAARMWEAGYRELGGAEFLHRLVAHHRSQGQNGGSRQATAAMVSAGKARPRDPLPSVMAAALLLEAGKAGEAMDRLQAASEAAPAAEESTGWADLVSQLLRARGKLEAGDRLAAESAFLEVAAQAGRRILGETPSGMIIRPVEGEGPAGENSADRGAPSDS